MDAECTVSQIDPQALGLSSAAYPDLPGGDAEVNARLFLELLDGKAPRALVDVVSLSAALVLWTARRVPSLLEGLDVAREALTTRAAYAKFEQYRTVAIGLSSPAAREA
jgi:anthranilate phosphoribosyltransferase